MSDMFSGMNSRMRQQSEGRDDINKKDARREQQKGFNYEKHGFRDVEFFEPQVDRDDNIIDIIPFVIEKPWYEGLHNQQGQRIGFKPGQADYMLEMPLHRYIGPNAQDMICIKQAFGKKCPLCQLLIDEYVRRKAGDQHSEAAIERLKVKWRNWFNIYNYATEQFEVWDDVSYHLFAKYLNKAAEKGDKDNPYFIPYAHPEEGKTLIFPGIHEDGKGGGFDKFSYIKFEDRNDPYTMEDVAQSVPFDLLADDLLLDTEEMEELYFQDEPEDRQEEKEERRNSNQRGVRNEVSRKERNPKTKNEDSDKNRREESAGAPNRARDRKPARNRSNDGNPGGNDNAANNVGNDHGGNDISKHEEKNSEPASRVSKRPARAGRSRQQR